VKLPSNKHEVQSVTEVYRLMRHLVEFALQPPVLAEKMALNPFLH
jgi:hypothetical protein